MANGGGGRCLAFARSLATNQTLICLIVSSGSTEACFRHCQQVGSGIRQCVRTSVQGHAPRGQVAVPANLSYGDGTRANRRRFITLFHPSANSLTSNGVTFRLGESREREFLVRNSYLVEASLAGNRFTGVESRSKRSRFIILLQAATKSWTNFCCESSLA
jgi:hypothetical protein